MLTKKIKPLLTVIIISVISLGNSFAVAGVDGSPFEGLYVGLVTIKNTFSSTASYLEVPVLDDTTGIEVPSLFNGITSTTNSNSYGGGIVGGYGLNTGIFYAGVEAAIIVDKGNTVISDGENTFKLSKSNTLDVNLRAGVTLSDKAMVFALLGYSGAVLKSSGVNRLLDNDLNFNKRITSYRFGGGVEFAFMENIAIRLEYTRSRFSNTEIIQGSDQFLFKPTTSRIMASLILHMY